MLDPKTLLTALAETRVVIVGGMAAVVHGAAHVTADLDLCYARTADDLRRLADALAPFEPRLRDTPAGLPFRLDAEALRGGLNFTLTTAAGDLDLFGEIPGLGGYDAVAAAAEPVRLFGRDVLVLGLDGLIRAKEAAGRDKDRRMLPELRALKALRER